MMIQSQGVLGYRPRLDGIRAIAVFLVIASHCFVRLHGAGPAGVGIFFVLSGFLITSILDREFSVTGELNLRNFYARRVLRLYPALVCLVAAYLVGFAFGAWPTSLGRGLVGSVMALTYTTDIFTIVGKGRWPAYELLLTWTLSVEEQFYLLWPLTYLGLMRRFRTDRVRISVLIGGILVAAVLRAIASRYAAVGLSPIAWTDALLIGCLAGLCFRRGWIPVRRPPVWLCVVAAGAVLRIAIYGPGSAFDQLVGLTLFDLGAAVLIFYALAPARHDLLGSPVMRRLGRISYGIYLWHSLVLNVLVSRLPNTVALFVIVSVLTVALAEVSYRVIELPFLRIKRRFEGRVALAEEQPNG